MRWVRRAGLVISGVIAGFIIAALLIRPYRGDRFEMTVTDNFSGSLQRIPELEALSAEILGYAGLHDNIQVYLDTYNPAQCGYSSPPLRTIILTARCSKPLRAADGSYNWRVVGILAHEIGHVLNGHGIGETIPRGPQWQQDEADEFAGWAMRKLGATLAEAKSYAQSDESAVPEALAAVERGWRAAN